MKRTINIFILLTIISCQTQEEKSIPQEDTKKELSKVELYYSNNTGNEEQSISSGTVSKGTLKNGKLMPFQGDNFQYFDTLSYLRGRAYTNGQVRKSILDTYQDFINLLPNRFFYVMECSNQNGGKIHPHRTHQNGMSIDFMMPLIKDNKPYYKLDTIGKDHYWLEFNNKGEYVKDQTIAIDFDLVALHILTLDQEARNNGLKISKVIIKTELKDELFASENGKKLKASGIYIVKSLTPIINSLHDEHYHIDFEKNEIESLKTTRSNR